MTGYLTGFNNDLIGQFNRMQSEMNSLLGGGSLGIRSVASGSFPAINVGSTPDAVEVYVFAPGVDANDLDVSMQQNLLSVSGSRAVEVPERAYRNERFSGKFHRVVTLPEDADGDQVSANYRDGVLQIKVPRREVVKARKISVD